MEQQSIVLSDIQKTVDTIYIHSKAPSECKRLLRPCHSSIVANLIFIKSIWYSREDYYFSNALIADLFNAYASLASNDIRIFYFYLRSSIENFYKSSTQSDGSRQISYYKAEQNFNQLTARTFNYIWQFKYLKIVYNQFSDQVHSNPSIRTSKAYEYMQDVLQKDDFSNPKIFSESSHTMLNLLEVFNDFYKRAPGFSPREDSFYRHQEQKDFLLQLI